MKELHTQLEKREVFIPTGVSVREGDDSRIIEGVAIVTNAETILYEGSDWREIEVIDPSCLDDKFLSQQDMKLNLLHERELTIARCNKGAGNMTYEVREDGLHFVAGPLGDFDLANRALELVKSGVYSGCSFEFYPQDYEVTEREGKDGKEEYIIRHKAFRAIDALTIAMAPAYPQTSVNAREIYREQHPITNTDEPDAEQQKREAEAQVKAKREQLERDARIAQIRREVNTHNL